MNRRNFLGAAASAIAAQTPAIPIIDTHIHLFDPTRPKGVPWPPKSNTLIYKPTLPEHFRKLTQPHGVKGAIYVECSPWVEDNDWVLDVVEKDTIMVGVIGDLEPGKPDFRKHLARLHKNKLFLGIRFGYLWGRSVGAELPKPQFIADLKEFAAAGLTLDTVGPAQLPGEVVRITDQVPNLRVVIDHLPNLETPKEKAPREAFLGGLRELAKRPHIYIKISEVLHPVNGRVSYDLGSYRAKIDELYDIFGPDRVLYGSDWPNSEPVGNYAQVLGIVREYFAGKGRAVSEKFFWQNSISAYRWMKREVGQPA